MKVIPKMLAAMPSKMDVEICWLFLFIFCLEFNESWVLVGWWLLKTKPEGYFHPERIQT